MEHPWLFYILCFLFGFISCKTFYFLNASRKSIRILQLTQVTALFIITRALEKFHYAREYHIAILKENGESEQNVNAFNIQFEEEVEFYKRKSISSIIDTHGSFFKEAVDFTNWETAMFFLEANRTTVAEFLTPTGEE